MTNKLFIGGLEYSTTDAQLEEHFSKIGKVLSAKVIIDRDTGQERVLDLLRWIQKKLQKKQWTNSIIQN